MKKLLYPVIAALMALALVACSPAAVDSTTESTTLSAPEIPAKPNNTPPQNTTGEAETWTPIVLVENEDICVKITGVENDPIWGYTLKVYLENNTQIPLTFTVDDVSVNGFMCDPFWAEFVSPGKKSNSTIYWFESTLAENGITTVDEISLTLQVYNSDDLLADDLYRNSFSIHP